MENVDGNAWTPQLNPDNGWMDGRTCCMSTINTMTATDPSSVVVVLNAVHTPLDKINNELLNITSKQKI